MDDFLSVCLCMSPSLSLLLRHALSLKVTQADLKLIAILLLQPPSFCDYKHEPLHLASFPSLDLGKHLVEG